MVFCTAQASGINTMTTSFLVHCAFLCCIVWYAEGIIKLELKWKKNQGGSQKFVKTRVYCILMCTGGLWCTVFMQFHGTPKGLRSRKWQVLLNKLYCIKGKNSKRLWLGVSESVKATGVVNFIVYAWHEYVCMSLVQISYKNLLLLIKRKLPLQSDS
jgi:hypothetical protein